MVLIQEGGTIQNVSTSVSINHNTIENEDVKIVDPKNLRQQETVVNDTLLNNFDKIDDEALSAIALLTDPDIGHHTTSDIRNLLKFYTSLFSSSSIHIDEEFLSNQYNELATKFNKKLEQRTSIFHGQKRFLHAI